MFVRAWRELFTSQTFCGTAEIFSITSHQAVVWPACLGLTFPDVLGPAELFLPFQHSPGEPGLVQPQELSCSRCFPGWKCCFYQRTCGKVSRNEVRLCPRAESLGMRSCCCPHHCCHTSGFTWGHSPATPLFWGSHRCHLSPTLGTAPACPRVLPLPGALGVSLVGSVLVPGVCWEVLGGQSVPAEPTTHPQTVRTTEK